MIPFVLKSVHDYFQDLWDFLLYSLGQISEGAGMSEGPGEDCIVFHYIHAYSNAFLGF